MHWVHRGGGGEEILDRHRSRHLGPPPIVTAVYVSISTPVWTNTSTRTSRILLQISTWLFDCFLSQSSSSTAALGFCRHSGPNFADVTHVIMQWQCVRLFPGDWGLWPLARCVSQVPRAPGPAHSPDSQLSPRRADTAQAGPCTPGSEIPSTAGSDHSPCVSSGRGKHRIVCGRSEADRFVVLIRG